MRVYKLRLQILGIILLLGPNAFAQTATGSISGVVQDETGAVIPNANVTVTNVDTGISSSLLTDASGRYHAPTLIPGHYEIQAQVTGFETGIRKGTQVTVGSNLEINMVLKVGQVTEKTVVTAEAPIVETTSSAVSGLVDDKTIRELPLNGRSFDQLISLDSSAPTFHARSQSITLGVSNVYTVNGARVQANLFLIDGTEMLGGEIGTTLPGGALGINMGVDAVQEFSVLSANYSSAYGKKGGGIINIATRSGTNQIHGSAFEFIRNSDLDARNFFDPGSGPPSFKRNEFGGALGGPIQKDHSFIFGTWEGLRQSLGLTNLAIVPDANARQAAVPSVKPYLAVIPLPNGRNFGDGTGESLSAPQQPSSQDFFLVRFDQKISDKDSFFVRYNFDRASQTTPQSNNPIWVALNTSRDQILTLEEKRAYARMVNVVRFGFTRGTSFNTSLSAVPLDPTLRFVPTADTVGQMNFTGLGSFGGPLTNIGPPNAVNRTFVVNQFDVGDQVFRYSGPHSLQFGVQVQRIQHNDHFTSGQFRGTFQFSSLASFLAGQPLSFTAPSPSSSNDPTKAYRQTYFSSFIQDDYKVFRNLTLNLGLRYELMTVPIEASGNRISNYHYKIVNGITVLDSLPTVGSPFFQGHHDTFAPRIGFAWDPFSTGKLAVRGGFGIFYDQIDSDFRFWTANNLPFGSRSLQVPNPPFPNGFSGATGNASLPAPDVIDFALNVPTRLQYSFGVQREITPSSAFNIAYVGSHSYHLTRLFETNTALSQILPGGVRFYPLNAPRINPVLGSTHSVTSDADAFYDSVQLNFIQRLSHGVRYKVSYTYAKNIDEAYGTVTADSSGSAPGTQDPLNPRGDRGLSAFDVRNNLVMNFNYDIPGNNLSGFSGRLLGGWQLGAIFTIQSGTPFTALTGFNRSRDLAQQINGDRPDLTAGANNNPVLGGPDRYFDSSVFVLEAAGFYGNLGKNTLIGPGFADVDSTLAKTTSINERLKVDLRAEFFNLLNRANFGMPAHAIFSSNGQNLGSAGRIQNTVTSSRQIQFGMKLIF